MNAQKEIARLADDLAKSREDVGARSAELLAKNNELKGLKIDIGDAQKKLEGAIKENERLKQQLLKAEHHRDTHEGNHATAADEDAEEA